MYSSLLRSINCSIYTPNFLYLGDLPIKNNHALSHKVAPPLSALMLVSLAHFVCVCMGVWDEEASLSVQCPAVPVSNGGGLTLPEQTAKLRSAVKQLG